MKSDRLTEYTVALRSRLVFLQFADRYLELHGKEVRARFGKSSADFAEDFEITPDMLKDLQEIAKAKNIEFNKEQYEKDLRYVKAFAKAHVARNLWGNEGYSRTMLREDAQFKKAISLFGEAERIAKNMAGTK